MLVPMVRGVLLTLGALSLGLVSSACGADDADAGSGSASSEPSVVVTTTILGDVVRDIAGDQVTVEVLMPVGADPHDFELSARQSASLQEADLVIANGLELEAAFEDSLAEAVSTGVTVVEVGDAVDPIPFAEGDAHAHGADDPHFWQDPKRMATAVPVVADALSGIDGVDAAAIEAGAKAYAEQLDELDAEVQALVARVPENGRKLVTNHEAFGYFAERYGFVVIGTVIPSMSTQADPSAKELAALADEVREEGVPAVFAENTSSTDLAEALSAEVGSDIAVVELYSDSLGEPGSGAETYAGLVRTNATRITDALAP